MTNGKSHFRIQDYHPYSNVEEMGRNTDDQTIQ
mgnify:CR=1 FL=1